MKFFLVLLLAHIIADFIAQTHHMIQQKYLFSSPYFSKGILYHCIHHIGISLILSILFLEWTFSTLLIIPLIGILHYFIDLAKIKTEKYLLTHQIKERYENQTWYHLFTQKKILFFIGDQLAHVVSIYLILLLFSSHVSNGEFIQLFTTEIYEKDVEMRYLMLSILFILATFPAAHLISILMSDVEGEKVEHEIAASLAPETKQKGQLKNQLEGLHTDLVITEAYKEDHYSFEVQYHQFYNTKENPRGRYIGMLERILIVVFVVSNLIQGLALIIAMKTLTRFKQFEDKRFAEYYLIGTLLSLLIGVILALMMKKIW